MRWLLLIGTMMALAACRDDADTGASPGDDGAVIAVPEGDGAPVLPEGDACGASGYAGLVGAQLAAVTLPADLNARIIEPDTAVTMVFEPDRLNIRVDDDGIIIGVDCG